MPMGVSIGDRSWDDYRDVPGTMRSAEEIMKTPCLLKRLSRSIIARLVLISLVCLGLMLSAQGFAGLCGQEFRDLFAFYAGMVWLQFIQIVFSSRVKEI